jgi:Ca2+-binding RTX toxin-like protein
MFEGSWRKLGLAAALSLAACSEGAMAPQQSFDFDATGFDGLSSQQFPVLMAGDCVVEANGDLTLAVEDDEVLYLFKRVTDGKLVANALPMSGECATTITATRRVIITGSTGANKVLVDFLNGSFAPGVKTPMVLAGIAIDLLGGTDEVTVRGTTGVDNYALGRSTGMTPTDGVDFTADKVIDMTLAGVESIKLSTGAGADVFNGMGVLTSTHTAALGIPMTAFGGADADTFTSGAAALASSNVFEGGAGDDNFTQQNNKAVDQMIGGAGRDTVSYAVRTAAVSIIVGDATANDGESGETDEIDGDVETIIGGTVNDSISAAGSTGSVASAATLVVTGVGTVPIGTHYRLVGGAGNDTLTGSDAVDFLQGDAGDDLIIGGTGNDTIFGGANIDTVSYQDRTTDAVTASLNPGATPMQQGESGEVDVYNAGLLATHDVENLKGGDDDDTLTGNDNANIIWGGAGVDTVDGGVGADTLYGEAGDDDISGGDGGDVLVGGAGNDTMDGGDGDDLIDALDAASTDVAECGLGNDVAVIDAAGDLTANGQDDTNNAYCELLQ